MMCLSLLQLPGRGRRVPIYRARSADLSSTSPPLHFLSFIKWKRNNLRRRAPPAYVDIHSIAGHGMCRVNVSQADIFIDSDAWRPAGKRADGLIVFIDEVAAPGHAAIN